MGELSTVVRCIYKSCVPLDRNQYISRAHINKFAPHKREVWLSFKKYKPRLIKFFATWWLIFVFLRKEIWGKIDENIFLLVRLTKQPSQYMLTKKGRTFPWFSCFLSATINAIQKEEPLQNHFCSKHGNLRMVQSFNLFIIC